MDTLQGKSYEELQNQFIENLKNNKLSSVYAEAFLKKATLESDTLKILRAFSFLSLSNSNKQSCLAYSDSLLKYARIKNNKKYLSLANMNKGDYYYTIRKFRKAIDYYIEAREHVESGSRKSTLIDYNIGLLKSRLGKNEEAELIFKKAHKFFDNEYAINNDNTNYLTTLFAVADILNKNKKYDSASFYNSRGIAKSLEVGNYKKYIHFVLNEAVNDFDQGKILEVIDSIEKISNNIDQLDDANKIVYHYYYGETSHLLGQGEEAIKNYKFVDSIFQKTGDLLPVTRGAYERIISYYKEKNDVNNQLKYIKRLLKVDSVLTSNYIYISEKIDKDYDTPKLIEEKQNLIASLKNKNSVFKKGMYLLSFFLVVSLIGLFFYYRRQRKLKNRFQEILITKEVVVDEVKTTTSKKDIGIPPYIIDEILEKLRRFEKNKQYTKNDLKLSTLAEEFNTNTRYLSKIINGCKGKSFTNYINELRVDSTIEELKNNTRFRMITIQAIANEVGFNSAEAFSKAFHKKTGLYPSYFIKNIKSQ